MIVGINNHFASLESHRQRLNFHTSVSIMRYHRVIWRAVAGAVGT